MFVNAHPDTEGCDHTWRKFHGHCYRYFSRRHTWEDAEKDCREHNGHLASIHSPAEQNFIRGEQRCGNGHNLGTGSSSAMETGPVLNSMQKSVRLHTEQCVNLV